MHRTAEALLVLAILTTTAVVAAPPAVQWVQDFGSMDTFGLCVQQTSDSGYVVAGIIQGSSVLPDIYLLKTDQLGNKEWGSRFGGEGHDYANAVRPTEDGGYILAGWSDSEDSSRAILLKVDSLGDSVWTYRGPGLSGAMDVQQTPDGGFIAAGYWEPSTQVHLIKVDAQGNGEWMSTLPDSYTVSWTGAVPRVQQTQDGGYVTAAERLVKTDSLGTLQWNRAFDDVSVIFSAQQTSDGGYIATGIGSNPTVPHQTFNVVLLKTDSLGQLTWKRVFRGGNPSGGCCVRETPDGGYFITGQSGRPYLIRTNSQGTALWTKTLTTVGYNMANWGEPTLDGGYIIIANCYLVKLAPEGE